MRIFILHFGLHLALLVLVRSNLQNESLQKEVLKAILMPRLEQGENKKIAFMFLMEKYFDMHDIWKAYLRSAPRSEWSVYVHLPRGIRLKNSFQKFVLSEDKILPTSWCGDLISPVINLMKEALRDPANAMFVLVSPKDIPVKPFPLLRSLLLRTNNSWVCLWDLWTWSRWDPGAEEPKHHQWFAFTRTEAQRQVEILHSKKRHRHGCWDENWIMPPRMNLSQADVEREGGRPWPGFNDGFLHTREDPRFYGRCMTYVWWNCTLGWCNTITSPFKRAEDHFHDTRVAGRRRLGPISYCFLEYLRDESDFLFARKVLYGINVSYACHGAPNRQQSVSQALRELGVLP